MEITERWLNKQGTCEAGVEAFLSQKERNGKKVIEAIIADGGYLDWGNWLIVRIMTYGQRIQYAIYSTEQCLENFEKKYPEDKRPRETIEAAKTYLQRPTEKNRRSAYSASMKKILEYGAGIIK